MQQLRNVLRLLGVIGLCIGIAHGDDHIEKADEEAQLKRVDSELASKSDVNENIENKNMRDLVVKDINAEQLTEEEKKKLKDGISRIKSDQEAIKKEMAKLIDMVQSLRNLKSDASITLDEIADQIKRLEEAKQLTKDEELSVEAIVVDVESLQKQQNESNNQLKEIETKVSDIANKQTENDEELTNLLSKQ